MTLLHAQFGIHYVSESTLHFARVTLLNHSALFACQYWPKASIYAIVAEKPHPHHRPLSFQLPHSPSSTMATRYQSLILLGRIFLFQERTRSMKACFDLRNLPFLNHSILNTFPLPTRSLLANFMTPFLSEIPNHV